MFPHMNGKELDENGCTWSVLHPTNDDQEKKYAKHFMTKALCYECGRAGCRRNEPMKDPRNSGLRLAPFDLQHQFAISRGRTTK